MRREATLELAVIVSTKHQFTAIASIEIERKDRAVYKILVDGVHHQGADRCSGSEIQSNNSVVLLLTVYRTKTGNICRFANFLSLHSHGWGDMNFIETVVALHVPSHVSHVKRSSVCCVGSRGSMVVLVFPVIRIVARNTEGRDPNIRRSSVKNHVECLSGVANRNSAVVLGVFIFLDDHRIVTQSGFSTTQCISIGCGNLFAVRAHF
mmetsp:Transcript_1266/g.2304  ORF Transcript_1266/g.2304 Transcript_1266/m.2304 type:complete len:208 (+) Transcript_1266:534-1157(+)